MTKSNKMTNNSKRNKKRKAGDDASHSKKKFKMETASDADAKQLEEAMRLGLFPLLLNRLPADGPQLSTTATKALLRGKVTVTVMKQDPNFCMKNDMLGLWDTKMPFFRQNSASLLMSCLKRRGLSLDRDFQTILGEDCRTALFLSFEKHPEKWLDIESDPCLDKTQEPWNLAFQQPDEVDQFMESSMKAKFVDYKKCNTRYVEQDTNYHRVDNTVSAVIVGDVNTVANTLAPCNLTYAEACDRTIKSIFGMRSDADITSLGKNFKRSNDFPVLVGLDTLKYVEAGDKVYAVDFYRKSLAMGKPLVPLLLTSATEVILRVQLQYLNVLYHAGHVLLNPEPQESNSRVSLHGLDDQDTNSIIMNLVRSDSFLYAVCVECPNCCKSFNHLWKPGVEATAQNWLSQYACDSCGEKKLQDLSAFVMKDAPSRRSLDPASLRRLQWEVPIEKKEPLLPTDVASKADLTKFECVAPEGGIANMKVCMSGDYPRKNQRTSTVAVTMYVPVAFDMESTLADVRNRIGDHLQLDWSHESNCHVVKAYTFLGLKEHELTLTMTRVKLTLTCNKKSVPAVVSGETLHRMKCQLARVRNTLNVEPLGDQQFKVMVDMPAVQTNKRIGVQTVYPNGIMIEHTSKVLLAPASRVDNRRQKQACEKEDGTMYSALNFWCHPNWEEKNNFLRYGPSLVAGLVYNMYAQGKFLLGTREEDQTEIQLLPVSSYKWIELEQLDGSMSPKVAQYLYSNKKLELVGQLLKEKETLIKQQEKQISEYRQDDCHVQLEQLKAKLEASEKLVGKLREEKLRLERENKNLKREIRSLTRTVAKMEDTIQSQDTRLENLEKKLEELLKRGESNSKENEKQQPEPPQTMETDLINFVDNYDLAQDLDEIYKSWCTENLLTSGEPPLSDDLSKKEIPDNKNEENKPLLPCGLLENNTPLIPDSLLDDILQLTDGLTNCSSTPFGNNLQLPPMISCA